MRHRRLLHGALVGRSRSLGSKLHFIIPESLTSYCSVPVTWVADEKQIKNPCANCLREMKKRSDRKVER